MANPRTTHHDLPLIDPAVPANPDGIQRLNDSVEGLSNLIKSLSDDKASKTELQEIIGAAPAALDTLAEIATRLQNGETVSDGLLAQITSVQTAITNLQNAVAAKLDRSGGHLTGNVSSDGWFSAKSSMTVYANPGEWAGFNYDADAGQRCYQNMKMGAITWQISSNNEGVLLQRKDENGVWHHNQTFNLNGHIWSRGYGWLHDYFAQKTAVVADVRLGAQQFTSFTGGYTALHTSTAPTGCVVTGSNYDGARGNLYYKPIQKLINGTWYTVGG